MGDKSYEQRAIETVAKARGMLLTELHIYLNSRNNETIAAPWRIAIRECSLRLEAEDLLTRALDTNGYVAGREQIEEFLRRPR